MGGVYSIGGEGIAGRPLDRSGMAMRFWMTLRALPATLLLVSAAHAQFSACDSLKEKLAARIESGGVRGYGLDITPASTPLPSGAKVIGTCDGGAFRLVYRRWAAARDAVAASGAILAETAPESKKMERSSKPPAAAPAPLVAAAAAAVAPHQAALAQAPDKSLPGAAASSPTALSPATPPSIDTSASNAAIALAMPQPMPPHAETLAQPASATASSWTQRASVFWSVYWPWICAAFLVPLAALGWVWYAHNRDYDEAGLPRGPKL